MPMAPAVPESDLPGEVAALRAEAGRFRVERRVRVGENVAQTSCHSIL